MPVFEFSFSSPLLLIFAFVGLSLATGFLFYRFTLPPVSRGWRLFLSLLRGVALALIVLLIFEPAIRLVVSQFRPPVVAILVDNSQSMNIEDRLGKRRDELQRVLAMIRNESFGDVSVRYYPIGTTMEKQITDDDSLSFSEEATNLSEPLKTLGDMKEKENISAIVLLTDGEYNIGRNPLYDAERTGLPLYTVGIGDSSDHQDILVSSVAANEIVYNESEAPVDFSIHSTGYDGQRVEVSIADGNTILAKENITLEKGVRDYAVRLSYLPTGEGTRKYNVRVSPLEGELTLKNNTKSFFVRVLKSRLRVFVLAGAPAPDVAAIKQTLSEDPAIIVDGRTQKSGQDFFEGPLSASQLDSADCIVTIDFPTSTTSQTTLNMLRNAIVEHARPLFFVGGSSIDYRMLTNFAAVLPFTATDIRKTEEFVFYARVPTQETHPVIDLSDVGNSAWDRLPPLYRKEGTYRTKIEATTLAHMRIQGVILQDPLVAARSVQRQRSLAFVGYGLWRWRLMAQSTPDTEHLLATFLSNSVRWLTTREEQKPVRIIPEKNSFFQNEPVAFQAQVYDGSARPVNDARVEVTISYKEKKFNLLLRPIGNGRYEGQIASLGPGDYSFNGSATGNGTSYGRDQGRLTVGDLNLEFQETRMNIALLRQLAERTGGVFLPSADAGRLKEEILRGPEMRSREVITGTSIELWNWQYTLAVIIVLLSLEWFLRKRLGML